MKKILARVRHEVVLIAGVSLSVCGVLSTQLPAGPERTLALAALPILAALAARSQTVSVSQVEALIAAIKAAMEKRPSPK